MLDLELNKQFLAACSGRDFKEVCENVTKLLDSGADIHSLDEKNNNALHIAARYENLLLISLLLNRSCNPNKKNTVEELPFDKIKITFNHNGVIAFSTKEIMNLLLAAEDTTTRHTTIDFLRKKHFKSPLQLALEYGCITAIEAKINQGAEFERIKIQDFSHPLMFVLHIRDGNTSQRFSKKEAAEIGSILLTKMTNLQIYDKDKRNALHLAAIMNAEKLCQELIEKDPLLLLDQDRFKKTPIQYLRSPHFFEGCEERNTADRITMMMQ